MTENLRPSVNGMELEFTGGNECAMSGPLVYTLSVDGVPFDGERFDPHVAAYENSFLVARRAKGLGLYGFAVYWFDPVRRHLQRVSKVYGYLSVRSSGADYVEAATKAFGDGDVRRIPINRPRVGNSMMDYLIRLLRR